MTQASNNNKRIAKNTILLYLRTTLVMIISLYTSRIILQVLGVEDFGIYNVVGGVVAMFSILTGALSSAISRYITYELGREDSFRLKKIFSTSINIQIVLSIVIFIVGESIGAWFLNNKLNIPNDRLCAANWVLHCSLVTFILNLLSVPYNATIIAHEKMKAFAYVSLLEVSLKLVVVYLLYLTSIDKLISYAILLVITQLVIRITYGIYCSNNFEECVYIKVHDNQLVKEMTGFAGWSFLTNAAYLFNTQGVNILINIFFGVGVNAARGIATQVETAILKFVNDFTTAINPQITKSYAKNDINSMNKLVCRGAKFSYYLQLMISIPIFMESDYLLQLWLGTVPEYASIFLKLTIIGTLIERLGTTCTTACLATGKIRKYVLCVTSAGCLVFPLTYLVFRQGAPVETTYIVFIVVYLIVNFVRLYVMKNLIGFPVKTFVFDVMGRCLLTTLLAIIPALIVIAFIDTGVVRLGVSIIVGSASAAISSFLVGIDQHERGTIKNTILKFIRKIY